MREKFTLELNGVRVEKTIPTDWDDVSFGEFVALNGAKRLDALAAFTGISKDLLHQAKVKNMDRLINLISFLDKEVPLWKLPKTICDYPIRQDLGFEPFGRYTDIKDEVDKGKTGMDLIKQYPLLCAIYCHPGKYDFKEAEKNTKGFYNAPCTEVLALGNFLLLKLTGLNRPTGRTSLFLRILPKKARLAFLLWRTRLVSTVRFFIWKKKHHIQETR